MCVSECGLGESSIPEGNVHSPGGHVAVLCLSRSGHCSMHQTAVAGRKGDSDSLGTPAPVHSWESAVYVHSWESAVSSMSSLYCRKSSETLCIAPPDFAMRIQYSWSHKAQTTSEVRKIVIGDLCIHQHF